jgi:hypothetical protein
VAHLLVTLQRRDRDGTGLGETEERIDAGQHGECRIYGNENTYHILRDGEDYIASVGYVGLRNGVSIRDTLSKILPSFHQSRIAELKKELVGEYVLLIKKGDLLYVFSDFIGTRNVFYSEDDRIVSTSYREVENVIGTRPVDLDVYKVWEYIAMRYILYPTWLGRSTYHKRIKWLLPNEYLEMNLESQHLRVASIEHVIDNRKEDDLSLLSDDLISTLRTQIVRREYMDSNVSATLTGGHDSRLIAAIAAEHYRHIRYRIAVSAERKDTLMDQKVAEKVARVRGIPIDVHPVKQEEDMDRFCEFTEGLSPAYNYTITPLLNGHARYSLGLGGAYGTELFMELPWTTVDDYVQAKMKRARKFLRVEESIWQSLSDSIHGEFRRIRKHYLLTDGDDRDYIRLFCVTITARYGSFILSAYNRFSYQIDPFGCYPVLRVALRVAPTLWGNHKRLGGSYTVQKAAMAKIEPRMAKVMTYSHYRPMMPLSASLFPHHTIGYVLQVSNWLRNKLFSCTNALRKTDLPGGYHLSDGWEKPFLDRTLRKYGLKHKREIAR